MTVYRQGGLVLEVPCTAGGGGKGPFKPTVRYEQIRGEKSKIKSDHRFDIGVPQNRLLARNTVCLLFTFVKIIFSIPVTARVG